MNYFYTNVFQRSDKIYCRGYANNKRFLDVVEYEPYLFLPGPGQYKTVYGEPLIKKQFQTISDARKFIDQYSNVSNIEFYGMKNFIYPYINDEFPSPIDYDTQLIAIISLDIEVSSRNGMPNVNDADQEITAITLTRNNKTLTFGTKAYRSNSYVLCTDEVDLIKRFLKFWCDDDFWSPDIVTGWSVDLFDIPYLINRTRNLLGENAVKLFSPLRSVYEREITRGKSSSNYLSDRTEIVYEIAGITVLDYLQLYKKFTAGNRESYKLDHIAFIELGERKVDYSDIGTLDDLYEKDFERFIEYNIQDALLVEKLEKKLNFIQIVFSIAYRAKVNYIDTMTTSRPWDAIIHSYLLENNIAIPQQKDAKLHSAFTGAYVKEPQIGQHEWVMSFDFASLYPSILSQHNISPETFIKKIEINPLQKIVEEETLGDDVTDFLKHNNATITVNGCIFTKSQRGFIPELVDQFINERNSVKKKMIELKKQDINHPKIEHFDYYQKALKILVNGLYGSLGQKYFRWFDLDLAEAVTTTGQLATRYIEKKLNGYMNKVLKTDNTDYIVACDTDSVYIVLNELVKKCNLQNEPKEKIIDFLDLAAKEKLQPAIQKYCNELGSLLNVYKLELDMKREIIADRAIWRGAKMYILNVWDSEGVRNKEPELLIHGIEAVRSSTPMICRDNIKECLKIIMNKTEEDLQQFIQNFYNEFIKMSFEQISFPRSINNLEDYADEVAICKKSTPIHVRGALIYNHMITNQGLQKQIPLIRDKDKIRFAYLKIPNPAKSHVISVPDELPSELNLHNYIDYEEQWEKSFINAIKSITSVINWDLEKKSSLEEFFK